MGDSDVRLGQREQLSCRLFRAWDTNRNAPRVVPGPFIAIIRVRVTSCVACREGSAKWGRYVITRPHFSSFRFGVGCVVAASVSPSFLEAPHCSWGGVRFRARVRWALSTRLWTRPARMG